MKYERKTTPEDFARLCAQIGEYPADGTLKSVVDALRRQDEWTRISFGTVQSMVRAARQLAPCVREAYAAGKISNGVARQLAYFDRGVQEYLLGECMEHGIGREALATVKRHLNEGAGVAEAVARATGELQGPRKDGKARDLEAILNDIAKMGARWRASVAMAMDAVGELEAEYGAAYMPLFEKVYLLRHLIGEQYEFIDAKVKRYLNLARKRATMPNGARNHEEVGNADDSGLRTERGVGEVCAGGAAGQAVQADDAAAEGGP